MTGAKWNCNKDGFEKRWGNTLVIFLWPTLIFFNDTVLVTDETTISALEMLRSEGNREGKFIPPKARMRVSKNGGGDENIIPAEFQQVSLYTTFVSCIEMW
jgi:hypothetical protein